MLNAPVTISRARCIRAGSTWFTPNFSTVGVLSAMAIIISSRSASILASSMGSRFCSEAIAAGLSAMIDRCRDAPPEHLRRLQESRDPDLPHRLGCAAGLRVEHEE